MSLEFLSGFALIAFTLAALIYIIRELLGDRVGDLKSVRQRMTKSFESFSPAESKPVNEHMLGAAGNVIAHTGDSDRPMRVRINIESWPARSTEVNDDLIAVGREVKVIDVDGPVLVVETNDKQPESLTVGSADAD